MRFKVTSLAVLTGLALAGQVVAGPPVSEQEKLSQNFNSHLQMVESGKDGESFINNMVRDADKLNDYSLIFETLTFKRTSSITEKGKLYFKKPKMMRIDEVGEFNKGSVAVIGKDGKARAHSGGLGEFITLTLKADDKMLDAANGDRMEDSDFLSLATLLREHLKQGLSSRVSEKPTTVAGMAHPVFVLEVFHPSEPKTAVKRIYVDAQTNLPVRWDDYDYKDPCLSRWTDVKMNLGLSDDLFKL